MEQGKSIRRVLAVTVLALSTMAVSAQHGPDMGPQKDMAVDKATRSEIIESVIGNLNRAYVFPEKASVIEKDLRNQMQHGEFDAITGAQALAARLNDTLQRDSDHDGHLVLFYFEHPIPEQVQGEDSPEEKARDIVEASRTNFGVEGVQRLRGNLGYLDLHMFYRPEQFAPKVSAAMSLLRDTAALIIDLRKNHGGDPDSVMLFASYLFDQPTHLNDVYYRDENHTDVRWTTETVAGRKYGQARKIYLLTSHDTFSGAEDLAYALKYAGRATIIGEQTGGGAHAGGPRRLNAHFMMNVPSGRPINPVTHTDWEGVGVTPDVVVPADRALDVAQLSALKTLLALEKDPDEQQKLQSRINQLAQGTSAK